MKKLHVKLAWKVLFHGIKLPENKMEVVILDDDTKNLYEAIGIYYDRRIELGDKLNKLFEEKGATATKVLSTISKDCKHANEIAYCAFLLGVSMEATKNPFNVLKTIFSR